MKEKLNIALSNIKLNYIYHNIKNIKNINILELGVREGISTSLFLKVCDTNNGSLISVDIDDCSSLFNNDRWKFIKSRDDNFQLIDKELNNLNKLDVVYIDSLHEPNHVKKILFYYYEIISVGGMIFIDDISWLPYVKSAYRENSWNEDINFNTFQKLLEIKVNNFENINIEFSFEESGTAKITKKNSNKLNEPKKIIKSNSFKSFIRKLYTRSPKK